ncbi:MmgE/PrpD family protein [Moorena sp. SIO3H5]|uniref:MmgE/PrpD family protein n=1 Tax=Moorena sp. SIO3H5 TaxID=2607834 RepID=UPI0013B879C7|nr:MmgE/PrpD family protein [Moorena sp. SIO3H5]NEO68846.1 MmgE/PrpD family protein [Moorena sp. SIO3H5]
MVTDSSKIAIFSIYHFSASKFMNITQQLAYFIHKTEYKYLFTKKVTNLAKNAILDTIGVTLAGVNTPVGNIMLNYAKTLGGTQQASVLGSGFKTSRKENDNPCKGGRGRVKLNKAAKAVVIVDPHSP